MMKCTLDPGLMGTGYAIWDCQWRFQKAGIIKCSHEHKDEDWVERAEDIRFQLRRVVLQNNVNSGWLEYPAYFASAGGQMVAGRGDLLKLTFLTGILYTTFEDAYLVPVNQWKGQLPKDVVEKRVRKILGKKIADYSSHAIDAIGIGLAVSGRMK